MPFSADVIDETTRVLADGNRIHEENHGKLYRDSQGRVRNEMESKPPFPDAPVWSHTTIYDPVQQLTIFLDTRNKVAQVHHMKGMTPAQSVTKPPVRSASPPIDRLKMAATSSEQLGSMDIEGFTVSGTRRTITIQAGAVGNDKPITTVEETWYSPQLKQPLLQKRDDPRMGQTVHKLVNIQVGEPDPLLFQAPPDYEVKDQNPQ